MAQALAKATPAQKSAGDISDAFASLSGHTVVLEPRFAQLKKQLWKDNMLQSWREVLDELKITTKEIAATGPDIILRVQFEQIKSGKVDPEVLKRVRAVGTMIVEGAISEEEALKWKADILEYARVNKDHVRGYPADNIQVYEFYNSRSQTAARTHPNAIITHKWLLATLLHASDPKSKISLETPISYYDRLRIRQPGDATFALGPHIDGGSLERWEDPGYRSCFASILNTNPLNGNSWRAHDSFDVSPRIEANSDLYKTSSGQCSVYRPWQGMSLFSPPLFSFVWASLLPTSARSSRLRRAHLSA
ncbi:uncharacterized protein STEHIDRAFT_126484 [Stereum hirsutum FP-91666 SS1]|uniref:DUF1479-domain-containing protein n=1 Tax=Stereum hirsutum (strain FP-91666) TaxID=721885 RepID=R7RYS2_STEHR|nr:uncharacterized protein STEHIDRAFT_126484 [Stereum hirsutum FP-91666 SS1]EIM79482.1 hypothetical protein STEHIDRAFT_126484 [Stereum hirsutum FP-91666 SS1]